MTTGILILNYNTAQDTVNCIESVERHNTAPVKYIVVDNGSPDRQSVLALERFLESTFAGRYLKTDGPVGVLPYMTFLPSPSNDGYAEGNNKGLRLAFDDPEITHILVINNDILLTEDILPALLDASERLPRCGIVSPLLYRKDGETLELNCARRCPSNISVMLPFLLHNRDMGHILTRNGDKNQILTDSPDLLRSEAIEIDLPSGSCMFVNKDLFRKMDGFDPGTFLYYEENILFKKTEALQLKNYCIPGVSAIHLGAHSTRMSSNSFLQRCNADSADHYLHRYGKMSRTEKALWGVVRWAYLFRLKVKGWIGRGK